MPLKATTLLLPRIPPTVLPSLARGVATRKICWRGRKSFSFHHPPPPLAVPTTALPRCFSTQEKDQPVEDVTPQATPSPSTAKAAEKTPVSHRPVARRTLLHPPGKAKTGKTNVKFSPSAGGDSRFLDHWVGRISVLLEIPVGEMKPNHLEQVMMCFKQLRTQKALQRSVAALVHGFDLLDRLAQECVAVNPQQNPSWKHVYPMDLRALGAVLVAWKRLLTYDLNNTDIQNKLPEGKQLLQKVEYYRQIGLFQPNAITNTVLIDCLRIYTKEFLETPQLAQEIYERMLAQSQHDPFEYEFHPNKTTILNLIYLFGRAREPAERSDAFLQALKDWYDETRRPDLSPTLRIYAAVTKAHENVKSPAHKITQIAQEAWELYERGVMSMDLIALNQILHTLAATKDVAAAQLADTILQELVMAFRQGKRNSFPNQSTFLAVLSALGRSGQAQRADDVMTQLEDLYHHYPRPELKPDKSHYSALVWAYVKAQNAAMAEATVLRMSKECDFDLAMWNGVLAAWAQAREEDAAERTAVVIEFMEKELEKEQNEKRKLQGAKGVTTPTTLPVTTSKEANETSPVQTSTYNALMGTYANHKQPKIGVRLASDLFNWMQRQTDQHKCPDGNTYLALITACKNANEAAQAEHAIRLAMQQNEEDGHDSIQLDARHFNMAISAWAKSKDPNAVQRARALFLDMVDAGVARNIVTYNSMLRVELYHGGSAASGTRCLNLLSETKRMYGSGQLEEGPDQITYNTVLACLSKSRDVQLMNQGLSVFNDMVKREVQPDGYTYSTLMTIYSRLNEPMKVEQVFHAMQAAFVDGNLDVRPDFACYTVILQAWAKVGNPEATIGVLEEMNQLYMRGQLDEQPSTHDFNAVLQAWRRSGRPEAAQEALSFLRLMQKNANDKEYLCAPDIVSYNIVIGTFRKLNDVESTIKLFQEATSTRGVFPTIVTFCEVLTTLTKTPPAPETVAFMNTMLDDLEKRKEAFWRRSNVTASLTTICRNLLPLEFAGKKLLQSRLLELASKNGYGRNIQEAMESAGNAEK